jgi:menaquinone-9 beta-reductase
VVGAGPAGAALAIMLGTVGVETVLLDRATFPRDKPCGEGLMPAGVDVLRSIGVPVDAMPALHGVTYRVPGAGSASGMFSNHRTGRGARRLAFDEMLASRAADTANVTAHFGCEVHGLDVARDGVVVRTAGGEIRARYAVGADGLRSRMARWMGWSRAPRGRGRYALVGHAPAPASSAEHALDRVVVTVLPGCEVYAAPASAGEVLVAVLGTKEGLRPDGESARAAYARRVREAHPELNVDAAEVRGAGPFWVRPRQVAGRRVFLLGDAAGFLDPLTGDGMSEALVASQKLAALLASGCRDPERDYRAWERGQWRRRVFVNRLALTLTGSTTLARRALRRLERRPSTLSRLLEVNDGTQSLWSLTPRDWAALAGI